jgi:Pectinacetylesterase
MRPRLLPALLLLALAGACRSGTKAPAEDTRPVSTPEETWTWVGFPGARCMDGSATGIGVSRSQRSDRVLIFLEGGGACFNAVSCERMTANLDGYGGREFHAAARAGGLQGVFNRSNPDNPFRDWSYVYVPYCSGDVHAGSNPEGPRGRVHVGYRNIGLYLQRLVPTFPAASQVVLAGSSAGGFGAAFNYDRVQRAFGRVPVALLDDSGPMFSPAFLRPCLERTWREAWALDASLPPDCPECRTAEGGLARVLPYLARKYPERRLGLITSDADAVIRSYFGFGYSAGCDAPAGMPAEDFRAGVAALRKQLGTSAGFRLYTPTSQKHVFLHDEPLGASQVDGVRLTDWLRGLTGEASGWRNVPR